MVARAHHRALKQDSEVTLAKSGAEALKRLRDGEPFDVLVYDMDSPRMDGRTFRERLAAEAPFMTDRLILCVEDEAFKGPPSSATLLRKPVRLGELRRAISRALSYRNITQSQMRRRGP